MIWAFAGSRDWLRWPRWPRVNDVLRPSDVAVPGQGG
jgi:hypothetical protein